MNYTSTEAKEIWDLIKKSRKEMKEYRKKLEADMERSRKEREEYRKKLEADRERANKKAERQMEEVRAAQREAATQIKETSREIKKAQDLFTTQWGRLMESLVEGDLVRLLKEKGVKIERTSMNEKGFMRYIDKKGLEQKEICEVDIIAKNGHEIVVVEVKTSLTVRDVNKFLEVLKNFDQLLPEYKGKKVYGAVAYLRAQDSSDIYSEKRGLFVIRTTGSSSSITNKKGFKPKIFC